MTPVKVAHFLLKLVKKTVIENALCSRKGKCIEKLCLLRNIILTCTYCIASVIIPK